MFGRSSVRRVTPEALVLTTHGQARLQVEGRTFGSVSVCGDRRWAWGDFDETFVVTLSEREGQVRVTLSGLRGRVEHLVPFGPRIDMLSPPLHYRRPSLRVRIALPRSGGLALRRIVAPRLESLQRLPIHLDPNETESTP